MLKLLSFIFTLKVAVWFVQKLSDAMHAGTENGSTLKGKKCCGCFPTLLLHAQDGHIESSGILHWIAAFPVITYIPVACMICNYFLWFWSDTFTDISINITFHNLTVVKLVNTSIECASQLGLPKIMIRVRYHERTALHWACSACITHGKTQNTTFQKHIEIWHYKIYYKYI